MKQSSNILVKGGPKCICSVNVNRKVWFCNISGNAIDTRQDLLLIFECGHCYYESNVIRFIELFSQDKLTLDCGMIYDELPADIINHNHCVICWCSLTAMNMYAIFGDYNIHGTGAVKGMTIYDKKYLDCLADTDLFEIGDIVDTEGYRGHGYYILTAEKQFCAMAIDEHYPIINVKDPIGLITIIKSLCKVSGFGCLNIDSLLTDYGSLYIQDGGIAEGTDQLDFQVIHGKVEAAHLALDYYIVGDYGTDDPEEKYAINPSYVVDIATENFTKTVITKEEPDLVCGYSIYDICIWIKSKYVLKK